MMQRSATGPWFQGHRRFPIRLGDHTVRGADPAKTPFADRYGSRGVEPWGFRGPSVRRGNRGVMAATQGTPGWVPAARRAAPDRSPSPARPNSRVLPDDLGRGGMVDVRARCYQDATGLEKL